MTRIFFLLAQIHQTPTHLRTFSCIVSSAWNLSLPFSWSWLSFLPGSPSKTHLLRKDCSINPTPSSKPVSKSHFLSYCLIFLSLLNLLWSLCSHVCVYVFLCLFWKKWKSESVSCLVKSDSLSNFTFIFASSYHHKPLKPENNGIFKVLKENYQPTIIYIAKYSRGKIKMFTQKMFTKWLLCVRWASQVAEG